jgi:hypothetical protein
LAVRATCLNYTTVNRPFQGEVASALLREGETNGKADTKTANGGGYG